MIVGIKKILEKAQKGNYALGSFNTSNLEVTQAIIKAGVKLKSPLIIQTSESALKYSNTLTLYNIIINLAQTLGKNIPIALHLDHGKDMKLIKECLKINYSSIHIDASQKNFSQNIALTKKVVKMAKKNNIAVQGELGAILGKEGMTSVTKGQLKIEDYFTNPLQVQEFVQKTGIDTLAISIGTAHGNFPNDQKIDYQRLKEIRSLIKIPLVLHGGSGLKKRSYRKLIKNGIRIINIDTNLRLAYKKALEKSIQKNNKFIDPRKILQPATDAVQKEVEKMIKIFGSNKQP